MSAKVRKGDRVVVLTGRDKGKRGEVLSVSPTESRAVVQGVNIVKKHTKPQGLNQPGGIQEKEASIHLSNIALLDPKSDKPTRIGFRMDGDKKVRFAKASGEVIA